MRYREDTIDFQEEITLTGDSPTKPASPPPLPAKLQAQDDSWVNSLSPRARAVLRAAARPKPPWPQVPRIIGAVATPIDL